MTTQNASKTALALFLFTLASYAQPSLAADNWASAEELVGICKVQFSNYTWDDNERVREANKAKAMAETCVPEKWKNVKVSRAIVRYLEQNKNSDRGFHGITVLKAATGKTYQPEAFDVCQKVRIESFGYCLDRLGNLRFDTALLRGCATRWKKYRADILIDCLENVAGVFPDLPEDYTNLLGCLTDKQTMEDNRRISNTCLNLRRSAIQARQALGKNSAVRECQQQLASIQAEFDRLVSGRSQIERLKSDAEQIDRDIDRLRAVGKLPGK